MKFLIWFICLTSAALLMTFIEQGAGLMLPPIIKTLISGAAITIAIILCKKLKKKKDEDNGENPYSSKKERDERWRIQAEKDDIILNSNDTYAQQLRLAITQINTLWETDSYLYENEADQNAEYRSELYLTALTPKLFLDNYYLFKAGNYDDIKDAIYTILPYLVLDSLINMGLFIFQSNCNLFILREIINEEKPEYYHFKNLAQKILNEELNNNAN